ncbi:Protocadherin-8 Arcadlin Precursor [Larimichthys crocea]|uniref:Protocadherin-8 n=1 Tax=Larimichthys crocea TaxID=215358 RepID=A0A6G0IJA5_LARCR|nr:protocadherin-8 [Larimichthys crocea]KAE8291286.1 Protocadherin-8 Arcadlin Precursor [Larimichthys crocea]
MGGIGWNGLLVLVCVSLVSLAAVTQGKTVKYQTFEEDAPGTVIGNLAKDISSTPSSSGGSRTNFRMMKQFNSSFIRLRESDGQLTIGERIDRERICKHTLHCLIAFDVVSFSKEQFKLIHVEVEVKDINDNSPEFPRKESSLEISENTAVGTRIPLDFAVDDDVGVNYIQSYQISVNSHFSIDVLSRADGVKYAELVLMKELDRETQATYALELVAMDGGNPSRTGTTRINIKVKDYNDNSPVFDRNSFSVDLPEDAPVGSLLLDLNAEDPDEGLNGEVVYGFGHQVPTEIRQLFRVDRKTGRLTLESPIDFESKNTYEFDVQATDLGPNPSPAICKIVVQVQDVNDNAPEISITPMTSITAGIAYITEAAARESFVALVSTSDRDSGANGQVHCTLYGHDHFRLQQAYEDSFMIVSTNPLDREKIPEYNLTVVAEDLGSPPFRTITQYTIRLTDENDNAPVFSKPVYEVAVVENNAPGAYITTVVARDMDMGSNGKVSYKLADTYFMGSPISTFVSLDPASGSLYALRSFNYEVMKQLELRITASDGGSPPLSGSANVYVRIVDQNDNAPLITQPALNNGSAEVLLPRDAPSGYVITRVEARDADEGVNSELSYGLATGEPSVFSVNKATGEIYLNQVLSHDVDETLSVTVTVSDNGRPALTSTATLHFLIIAGSPPSDRTVYQPGSGDEVHAQWDLSVVIIVVLAGSCTLLLLAIILIATTCNRRKRDKSGEDSDSYGEKGTLERGRNHAADNPLLPLHAAGGEAGFDGHSYNSQPGGFTSAHPGGSDMCSASEDGSEVPCVYDSDSNSKLRGNKHEGYSTLPGYGNGKEAVRPITIWKGNSYTTISARDPAFSGKDSGKGDSDFNDSDSDVSGDTGLKKDGAVVPPMGGQNALWACTSECKVLGHSDRCWSPSAVRANAAPSPAPTLSSFSSLSKTASLPRDPNRRDNYYQAQIPKTVGLQSVYEKVLHREYDYVLVTPPRPVRVQEISDITLPVYTPTPTHCPNNDV